MLGETRMIKTFSSGLLGSNTYLYYNNGEGMVIDCGNTEDAIISYAHSIGVTIKYVVLTHAHYDHIDYIDRYRAALPDARIVCHEDEICIMNDSEANVSIYFGTPRSYGAPDMTIKEGDKIKIGEVEFTVLSTPGHTPGSICLLCERERIMFTGDTLFHYGRGRCDFKYGNEYDMQASLERLLSLDGEIVFYSGHGEPSKIKNERRIYF